MGLFSFLSAKKAGDAIVETAPKVVNGIMSGIDAAFFTQEEKAEFIKGMLQQLYDNFMPRAISRRVIAVIIFANFTLAFMLCLILAVFELKERLQAAVEVINAFQIGWLAITVTVFYFGYYGVQKLTGKDGK
jgi:hypothetical protein